MVQQFSVYTKQVTRDNYIKLLTDVESNSDAINVHKNQSINHTIVICSALCFYFHLNADLIQVVLRADRGWHPSYLTVFDPRSRKMETVLFRHNRDCDMSTKIRLDADGQRLICEGGSGPRTACGRGGLPERGRWTGSLLLRAVNFDPMGPDKLVCNVSSSPATAGGGTSVAGGAIWIGEEGYERDEYGRQLQQQQLLRVPPPNSYTFQGTYYTVFVKVASCAKPQGEYSESKLAC
jgi:hypothetical protein